MKTYSTQGPAPKLEPVSETSDYSPCVWRVRRLGKDILLADHWSHSGAGRGWSYPVVWLMALPTYTPPKPISAIAYVNWLKN